MFHSPPLSIAGSRSNRLPIPRLLPCLVLWSLAALPLFSNQIRQEDKEAKKLAQRVEYLGKLLKHTDPLTQARAARSLRRMGIRARPALPALIRALKDDDEEVRLEVIKALGIVSRENGVAVPALLETIHANRGATQKAAFDALAEIATQAKAAVPDLLAFLEDDNLRRGALSVLERMGSEAREAIPGLVTTLNAAEPEYRLTAARALGKIAAPPKPNPGGAWPPATNMATTAILGLARSLGDNDGDVRRAAALALAKFGPLAAPAVPDLIDGLGREDPDTHRHFAFALGEIGPDAASAVSILRDRQDAAGLMLSETINLALKKIEK